MSPTKSWIFVVLIGLFTSCNNTKKLVGLWQVESVQMGEQSMTPVAKWTQLNSDFTQQSGNGWRQHTVGSWAYDKANNTISLQSTNGLVDAYGGFTIVELDKEKMLWTREEEGAMLQVSLKKIEELPRAPFDNLIGAWGLVSGEETTSTAEYPYLFFRWDHVVVHGENAEQKMYGTYRTHGHRNELQIIYYEEPLRRVIWQYAFEGEELVLTNEVDGEQQEQRYRRVLQLPG